MLDHRLRGKVCERRARLLAVPKCVSLGAALAVRYAFRGLAREISTPEAKEAAGYRF
jgi:hypothetical protein